MRYTTANDDSLVVTRVLVRLEPEQELLPAAGMREWQNLESWRKHARLFQKQTFVV